MTQKVARFMARIVMVKKKKLSRNAIIGYPAGIITGVTYGLNPLFGKPLMDNGASIPGRNLI